jgi:uncharacterized cupin superfamily protein
MPKRINVSELEPVIGTLYPSPFDQTSRARERTKLGDQEGLTQLGVNFLRLPPGVWSGQRHWHTLSDEFFYVLAGEVVLVTDEGEEIFHAGDAAGFKAGDPDGHSFQNRSDADVLMLEIGTRNGEDVGHYSDIDLVARMDGVPAFYTHKDGTPYLDIKRRGPKDD